ncbi:MAG: hypothetical protein K2K21_01640 [Lachnospiraceae bacterium]|nr:hypothetical protein [Lachnospiraceae bacterium]
MDYNNLKTTVRKIEMPDEMKLRIINNCQSKNLYEMGENTMNRSKTNSWKKKMTAVAAVVFLCLCFTAAVSAAGLSGFFQDIINHRGTVTGTQYEQASDELEISIISSENGITVLTNMVKPDVAPYSELEILGIDSYQIVDMSGNIIIEGERTDLFEIINAKTEIKISLDNTTAGDYKLVIHSFVGSKKADQPLIINGAWECEFSI